MTEDERTIEDVQTEEDKIIPLSKDNYEMLRDGFRQRNAEGWIDVQRDDRTGLEARPVKRQEDRSEAERIESPTWIIREDNGDQYIVSEKTFEEKFKTEGKIRIERFYVDLSWDRQQVRPDTGNVTEITIGGEDVVAEIVCYVDIKRNVIEHIEVVGTEMRHDGEPYYVEGGIPTEAFLDNPLFETIVPDPDND